ncbi:hypothetical protein GUITHDRAFT_142101 [Guillardia theta CCMP2712]|uniref:Uncharacterized protein n=1 Tax=Guillardia theta (strain CCMP2712) TaxID=905079 RepID=L1IZT2_GUITC|nr:hypothetical protein GUITHDRAFT_142101 [Guillardia theta CCMP2712]EKX41419.1 hypothetical protein GUITHDRAFT_142101 [Guillardia theta CCMP2712]|eukprot:XP_005828399.1 hypothetical protein GUITHDRAFT_142101 [Guillardia theta CCMP2712]
MYDLAPPGSPIPGLEHLFGGGSGMSKTGGQKTSAAPSQRIERMIQTSASHRRPVLVGRRDLRGNSNGTTKTSRKTAGERRRKEVDDEGANLADLILAAVPRQPIVVEYEATPPSYVQDEEFAAVTRSEQEERAMKIRKQEELKESLRQQLSFPASLPILWSHPFCSRATSQREEEREEERCRREQEQLKYQFEAEKAAKRSAGSSQTTAARGGRREAAGAVKGVKGPAKTARLEK